MIQWFRDLLGELRGIRTTLGGVLEALHGLHTAGSDTSTLEARLAALELSIDKREAQAEAVLLQAEGKFKAARASEERARRLAESSEASEEDLADELIEAYTAAGFPVGNGAGSEEEEVQPVHTRMGRRRESKSSAHAMKFGR